MNEEEFKEWLRKRVNTQPPISSYPKALIDFIPNELYNRGENRYKNLFDCNDIQYIDTLYDRCLNNGDLHKFNVDTQSRVPSASLKQYSEFLKYKLGTNNNNTETNNARYNMQTKNIILYGSPGVGKTHNYQRIISLIENRTSEKEIFDTITNNNSNEKIELNNDAFKTIKDETRVEFVTFHQSYSYEDFIEGFRPQENGNIKREDGIFKNISKEALKNKEQNYYIVIDEINRGNISKIFGELITLIEEDKRDIYEVTLPYSKMPFTVPSNLYIIATMNSTDKSIATIDIALRRRFTFLKMKPSLELVEDSNAKNMMKKLNIYITNTLGEDYQLGHSYFMKVQNDDDLEFIKEYKIKPLLEEYFYAEDKSVDVILNEALANSDG